MTQETNLDIKSIGPLKVQFKSVFNRTDSDLIFLKITLSEDLQKLIKDCIVNDVTDDSYNDGECGRGFIRYKVRKWVLNSLGDGRQLMFGKELVDRGETVISFVKAQQVEYTISQFKDNVKKMVEVYFRYGTIDVSLDIKLPKAKEEITR